MRLTLAVIPLLLALPILAACGGSDDTTATDPAGSSGGGSAGMPTAIPAAPGPVRTYNLVTVMDTGSPELCLGPVAESYPPQCSGPPIHGWDWGEHQGTYEAVNGVRWGEYSVDGTWDGETFTYTDAVAAALYDPMAQPEPTHPTPGTTYSEDELADIAEEVGELPGALSFYADRGNVRVDVVRDDGSLQAWADDTYGDGVVVVTSMLVDEG